ncbi:MAG: S9 family peptidase [Deltaproteobacteria bacterium]|nr:S9 family peptidase [Myxococcales bacterium]MDP3216329.1 S9 family peptidase [Deltaproteobacteria bacterium]
MRRPLALCLVALAACAARPARPTTVRWQPRSGPTLDQLLNVHRAWAPSPSPDGRTVAFLSDSAGLPQPYAVTVGDAPVAETAWRRLVTATERVQFVAYAPDGRFLFLGRDTGGDENTQLFRSLPDGASMVSLTPEPRVKTLFGALSDDGRQVAYAANSRAAGDFDVYVRPTDEGAARRVFEASGHHEAISFSPDGQRLLVTHDRSNFDQDVFVVSLATPPATPVAAPAAPAGRRAPRAPAAAPVAAPVAAPAPVPLLLTAHEGDVRYQHPIFTGDGRRVFVLSDHGREAMNLALLSADTPLAGAPTYVVTDEHDIELVELSGSTLALVFNVDGYSQLRLYDAADPEHPRELARPALPPGVISHIAFAHDGSALVVDLSRATSPDEVYRVATPSGAVSAVTASDHAGLDPATLVEPSLEHVRSFDGLDVPVFLYTPRGLRPGERAPTVVWVHGGPESQFNPYFNPVIQFLVGHGYVVAAPNVRGSTGYGKRFSHLDDVERREDSVRDLAMVNRWLRTRADVHPDRIAVLGGSYGGYMVLAALTLDPELWAAGCDIVGIANFRTFLERTASYRRALREAEYGSLARDGAVLDRISPIHRVDRIRAPLFVIHGANDPRVPVTEAEQIVAALRARNQRVEYLRFDNEGHGIFRRENRVAAYGALARFFDDVLGR